MADDAYSIYVKMLTEIVTQWLTSGSDGLKAFRSNVKIYFKTPKRKGLTEADEILEELRRMGLVNENKFDVLFELTDGIDKDFTAIIKDYENRIKQVTNSSKDTPNESENVKRRRTRRSCDSPSRKRERVSESDNGAEFRKTQDTSLRIREMHNFCDKKTAYSVGYIDASGSGGTGFAVGNKYVMTAYHVMRSIIERIWNATVGCSQEAQLRMSNWHKIHQELEVVVDINESPEKGIRKALKLWKRKNPHRLIISYIIEILNKIGFSDATRELKSFLQQEWYEKTSIRFGPDKSQKFNFKFDIPYMNQDLDVIILEINDTNLAQQIPKSLKLQRERQQLKSEMHLIGYPRMQDYEQILDPKCVVICSEQSKIKAEEEIANAIDWFQREFPNDGILFRQAYKAIELHLNLSEFVLFHSSESTAHCASGGPGIIEWDSDRPVVQAMLVSGCPSFTYSAKRDGSYYNGVKIPLGYLFEKGLLMARLHDQLSNDDQKLRNELFYDMK